MSGIYARTSFLHFLSLSLFNILLSIFIIFIFAFSEIIVWKWISIFRQVDILAYINWSVYTKKNRRRKETNRWISIMESKSRWISRPCEIHMLVTKIFAAHFFGRPFSKVIIRMNANTLTVGIVWQRNLMREMRMAEVMFTQQMSAAPGSLLFWLFRTHTPLSFQIRKRSS